jgi:DEAD/DEAH box helicase domain-containing protein
VGLSAPLFERRAELVEKARTLIAQCDCRLGCPACVGPVLASDETASRSMKELGAIVLALLADL